MNLHEFIAARLNEESNAGQLVLEAFPTLYANAAENPGLYGSHAPWTFASRDHLVGFAQRWAGHPDYAPDLHGPLQVPPR